MNDRNRIKRLERQLAKANEDITDLTKTVIQLSDALIQTKAVDQVIHTKLMRLARVSAYERDMIVYANTTYRELRELVK